jgi:23S rRNA pseudouridine2605 synthase
MKKKAEPKENLIRLNKIIADAGICSRRKADELISMGQVSVNGSIIIDMGTKVSPVDKVEIDGKQISKERNYIYILLNKPKDYITTTSDEKGRKTVMDLVKKRGRIYPVGRLDRNTTGALLLTNDGELANRLMHPRYEIAKMYNVTLDKRLKTGDAEKISKGINTGEAEYSPCELYYDTKDQTKISVVLREGKNREIHNIFEFLGYEVKKLDRKYYANLSTNKLERGEYRNLSKKEVMDLKKMVGLV